MSIGRDAAAPAGGVDVRAHNAALVFAAIARSGPEPRSRAQLAAATGLTRATVSTLVDDLTLAGLVEELGPTTTTGRPGRPGTPLGVADAAPLAVGVEIDADVVAVTALRLDGATVGSARHARDLSHARPPTVLRDVARRIHALVPDAPIAGVGVAFAGLVADGVVQRAPNMPRWHGVDVGAMLQELLPGTPVVVDNDANLAALAHTGAGERRDFLYVSGEFGVGAGLVLGGRVFRGGHGFAGEFGHVVVDPTGRPCGCGGRGCVEQYASEPALAAAVGLAAPYDPQQRAALVAALLAPEAAAATDLAGHALGVALASAVNLVDVVDVVLGGVYTDLAPVLLPAVEAELATRLPGRTPRLSVSQLGDDAAMHGAATTVVGRVLADPLGTGRARG